MSFDSSRVAGPVFFKTHHRIQALNRVKRPEWKKMSMYTYFLHVSLPLGNYNSCFQIKSSDYGDGVSVKLKNLNSYNYIFNPVLFIKVWKTVISDLGKTCLFHTKTNPKEIGADISIFLGSSVLYWHIVK